ncbi:MAG: hypothetical protein JWO52_6470 [Gammaproteobacteria bacterium]|nr:hypothetical protein [Gammaproteobacteria bacterium]
MGLKIKLNSIMVDNQDTVVLLALKVARAFSRETHVNILK